MSTNDYLTELPLSVVLLPPPSSTMFCPLKGVFGPGSSRNCIIVASHLAFYVFVVLPCLDGLININKVD